jgi:hypothetical protein
LVRLSFAAEPVMEAVRTVRIHIIARIAHVRAVVLISVAVEGLRLKRANEVYTLLGPLAHGA